MNKFIFYTLIFFLVGGAASCGDTISLDSLCIIELPKDVKLDDKICWVDKEKGEGFTLRELNDRFSVDEVDLRKVTEKLKTCQTQ